MQLTLVDLGKRLPGKVNLVAAICQVYFSLFYNIGLIGPLIIKSIAKIFVSDFNDKQQTGTQFYRKLLGFGLWENC